VAAGERPTHTPDEAVSLDNSNAPSAQRVIRHSLLGDQVYERLWQLIVAHQRQAGLPGGGWSAEAGRGAGAGEHRGQPLRGVLPVRGRVGVAEHHQRGVRDVGKPADPERTRPISVGMGGAPFLSRIEPLRAIDIRDWQLLAMAFPNLAVLSAVVLAHLIAWWGEASRTRCWSADLWRAQQRPPSTVTRSVGHTPRY
jgi:hypothetical protein